MTFPETFYYSVPSSKLEYTTELTGTFSIDRLLSGQPAFIKPSISRILKPKTLILADWTFEHWSPLKKIIFRGIFSRLHAEGFILYIWTNNELLQRSSLVAHIPSKICVETIFDAAKARGISDQQILILDDYLNEQLVLSECKLKTPHSSKCRGLSLLAIEGELQDKKTDLINTVNSLQKTSPLNFTHIVIDIISEKHKEFIPILKAQLPKLQLKAKYWALIFPGNMLPALYFLATKPEINVFKIYGFLLQKDTLINKIQYMKFSTSVQQSDFFSLLVKLKCIKHFNVGFKKGETPYNLSSIKLPSIDDIIFSQVGILDLQLLDQLVEVAPQLKRIAIDNYTKKKPCFNFKQLRLFMLEQFTLTAIEPTLLDQTEKITLKELERLFRAAPNLRHLDLSYVIIIGKDELFTMRPYSLLSLILINLDDSDVGCKALEILFLAAPYLQSISLKYCTALSKELKLPKGSLKELSHVDLSQACTSFLDGLSQAAPNINHLDLSSCLIADYPFHLEKNSLAHLTNLNLNGAECTIPMLCNLFSAAPGLIKINLKGFRVINENENEPEEARLLAELSLLFLEEIAISSSVSHKLIRAILAAAPKINNVEKSNKTLSMKKSYPKHPLEHNEAQPMEPVPPKIHDKKVSVKKAVPPKMHDHKKMLQCLPPDQNSPFQYKGPSAHKNQGQLIQQLSQYLTLIKQDLDIISKIKDGICKALAFVYLTHKEQQLPWENIFDPILSWNGKQDTLTQQLRPEFERLLSWVKAYQLKPLEEDKAFFIGHQLSQLLGKIETNTGVLLYNPWHAIAVYRINQDTYQKYDPNHEGPEFFTREALVQSIFYTCGEIISARLTREVYPPVIEDPNSYLRKGGLLALCQVSNVNSLLLALDNANATYTMPDLDGLLLRFTNGKPAWISGLLHPEVQYITMQLLYQFVHANDDFKTKLMSSIPVSLFETKACIAQIISIDSWDKMNDAWPALSDFLRDLCFILHKKIYKEQLTTWKPVDSSSDMLNDYCEDLLDAMGPGRNRLIECHSSEVVDLLCYTLEQHCNTLGRSVFYVDEPGDLICSAPSLLRREDNVGEIRQGPGGPLYEFLQTPGPLVLVINYTYFHPDEIVRFNTLLDTVPLIDKTPLPRDTLVIGVLNSNHPNYYQGSDFYSRFQFISRCTIPISLFELSLPPLAPTLMGQAPPENKTVIQLFNKVDWKSRLLGHWKMKGSNFSFQEGLLQQMIQSGHSIIEIHNGLWNDDEFKRFWNQIRRGGVRHAGMRLFIPASTSIYRSEGYDPLLSHALQMMPALEELAIILNTATLPDLLGTYQHLDDNTLHFFDGLIKKSTPGTTLSFHLTSLLNKDEWGELLTACVAQGITLKVYDGLKNNHPLLSPWDLSNSSFEIIESTDMDTTVALLSKKEPDWQVIDVSAHEASDLLQHIDVNFNQERVNFSFFQKQGALLEAIGSNKKTILKGVFSQSLIDALASHLIRYDQCAHPPQLKIIINNAAPFSFLSKLSKHDVKVEEKLLFLPVNANKVLLPTILAKEPLAKIVARMVVLSVDPSINVNTDAPWEGMISLPRTKTLAKTPLDSLQSARKTLEFMSNRKMAVLKMLECYPYVFITGCSGVGKTTFVQQELCMGEGSYKLMQGEAELKNWAMDKSPNGSLLFLDEANLSHCDWNIFEGLFAMNPGLLIDGIFYPLSDKHKIVFAGNPMSYGNERSLSTFFKRHGGAIFFKPLPQEVIYEKILKPILLKNIPEWMSDEWACESIFDAYWFFCNRSTKELLISPRELEMMALLAVSNYKNNKDIPFLTHLSQAVYQIGKSLLFANISADVAEFEKQFAPFDCMDDEPATSKVHQFLVTPSRCSIVQQLKQRLHLREWRIRQERHLNDPQKFGGLGGIIIEGEPGVGKSQMIRDLLHAEAYLDSTDLVAPQDELNCFYSIPVTLDNDLKKALLIKAFNEGAVVIMDEINCAPMMEQFLNSLLMGRHPDTGIRPQRPGFILIGTQNPTSMSGRTAPSTALARRMTTITLSEYTAKEMIDILVDKEILEKDAIQMVKAYLEQINYGKMHHMKPLPCFRDLLSLQPVPLPDYLKENVTFRKRKSRSSVEDESDIDCSLPKRRQQGSGFFNKLPDAFRASSNDPMLSPFFLG